MTFGKNLQRLREEAGLSQSGLARRSGLSVRSIQNWEIDRVLPRVDAAAKLARALGVALDNLAVFGEDDHGGEKKARKVPAKKAGRPQLPGAAKTLEPPTRRPP